MENTFRKVAQFELVHNDENQEYYIKNSITGDTSYNIDFERVEILMVLDRFSFVSSSIQRAGNNLAKKIQ